MNSWIKNLFKDSLVYGIGFGISRFLQIIVLPIIAHALSLSEFGYYSNYVIFYTIAGGTLVLGLDNSVARFMYDTEDKNYHKKIFSIAFYCLLIVSLIFVTIVSFFPAGLMVIISVPEVYKDALPYVLFTIPVLALNNFFLSWFKWKRQKYYFLINTIGTVLFLLVPFLIVDKIGFLYIFQVIFFSQTAVAIISILLSLGYIKLVFEKALLVSMLKYGFPWMLVFFLGLSRSYLDRFFLTHYLQDDNLYGVYNFSVRLATLLSLVITAFDMSFGPLAYSIWNKEGASQFFARLQSTYILFIGTVACLIVIISPLLVHILGGQKYFGAERILPYLLFSAIPLSLINFSSLGIIYAKKSFLSTVTLIIGFTAVLLLNAILTPRFLQFGAVNASLIGHLLIIIAGYYFSRRFYKIDFHFGKDALLFLFLFALSIVLVEFRWSSHLWTDVIIKTLALVIIFGALLLSFFKAEYKRSLIFLKNIRNAGFRSNARV
ncbi:MAG: lipopolysaccharide biosynthesis protein [Flavitalea sp.]